jgi:hypothetical protein
MVTRELLSTVSGQRSMDHDTSRLNLAEKLVDIAEEFKMSPSSLPLCVRHVTYSVKSDRDQRNLVPAPMPVPADAKGYQGLGCVYFYFPLRFFTTSLTGIPIAKTRKKRR